jgi:DNA-binding transcriptional MerR regulator
MSTLESLIQSAQALPSAERKVLIETLPDKLFFKIGEVCELVSVQSHVLRYWESEFPMFQPQKNRAGQRTYRRKDVQMALRIRSLLYEEGFTIAGANKKLQSEGREASRYKVEPPNTTELDFESLVPAQIEIMPNDRAARFAAIRQARGSLKGVLPSVDEFLAEKHFELERESK